MEIETWPIDKVIPYDTNPRVCPEKAVAKVAESLRTYGWRQPIVVDTEGVIIAGHTRRKAAELLGLKTVPVHVAHDMDPDDVRAYRIADNRVAEETGWDADLLSLEIGALREIDFDLTALGFDDKELAALMASGPPSLDELEAKHGDGGAGGEQSFWATLKFKVSPETKRAYAVLCEKVGGDSEDEQFANVVRAAARTFEPATA